MISKREEAKLLREQMILEKDQQLSGEADDYYDQYLSNLSQSQLEELFHQSNKAGQSGKNFKIPSLTSLCSEVLAKHIDQVEATGDLSVEAKTELAMHLSKLRKLTSPNLLLIINGNREEAPNDPMNSIGMSCLILHDCSSIDEDTMIKAICNANGFFATNLTTPNPSQISMASKFEPSLKTLILKNCGHAFTSWMVSRLNHYGVLKHLEYLTLAGLYRLSDQSLSDLFFGLSHSPSNSSINRLRGIDLSYSMSLNSLGLTSILNTSPHLTTLILDNTHLDQASLLLLCARQYDIPHLTELSMSGVMSLTDSILAFLLSADSAHLLNDESFDHEVAIPSCPPPTSSVMKPLGQRLKLLNLKACHMLSDGCFIAIRSFCSEIMDLNLSAIKSFTAPVNLLGLFISQVHLLLTSLIFLLTSLLLTLSLSLECNSDGAFSESFVISLTSSLHRLQSSTLGSLRSLELCYRRSDPRGLSALKFLQLFTPRIGLFGNLWLFQADQSLLDCNQTSLSPFSALS
jgi:hypothetical protein